MPRAEIPDLADPAEAMSLEPFAIPYPPARMRWALRVLGWSGHELARRIGMEQGSVRQMMRTTNPRECPERVAIWLETLVALYAQASPADPDDTEHCPPERLRELLATLGWSPAELSRRAGVSERSARDWLHLQGWAKAPAHIWDWLELLAGFISALPRPIGWERRQRSEPAMRDDDVANGALAKTDDAA